MLVELRSNSYAQIAKTFPSIFENQIRANIFLAYYSGAFRGDICNLRMPQDFRINMKDDSDELISFRPGEGATGMAFANNENKIAVFAEKWDDYFNLNAFQIKRIHKMLSWVISFPLKTAAGAFAVLNIDCLNFLIMQDQKSEIESKLITIQQDIQDKVDSIARYIDDKCDKVTIAISVN